jgi:hypothetical protein
VVGFLKIGPFIMRKIGCEEKFGRKEGLDGAIPIYPAAASCSEFSGYYSLFLAEHLTVTLTVPRFHQRFLIKNVAFHLLIRYSSYEIWHKWQETEDRPRN